MATVKVSFFLLAIVAVVALEVQCEEIVPGIPVIQPRIRLPSRLPRAAFSCTNIFGPRCQDCKTLVNCLGGASAVNTIKCADRDPKTPYCVRNVCSATPNPNDAFCKQPEKSNFVCTAEGYFPDPDKCSRYYICPGADQEAMAYDCPTNYVYRSKERGCGKQLNAADCPVVDCSKTPNEFGIYKTDPAYYYFCLNSGKEKRTVMMSCVDAVNTQYDPAVGDCTFRCTQEGKFVNVLDCTKYFTCYKVGTAWEVKQESCPPKYSFDSKRLMCVKGTCTPQVTTTTQAPPASSSATP